MYRVGRKSIVLSFLFAVLTAILLAGCGGANDGKTEITLLQYKPEAVAIFEELEERFNDKALEYVPYEGAYAVPYVANAAGILCNKGMFGEYGCRIPTTWQEFIALCEEIEAEGMLPMYFGFRETWTCLAPWNAIAVGLASSDVCRQVNKGTTTFAVEYRDVEEKMQAFLAYGPADPFAYDYNGACIAFANGEFAMYPIGNYAVPRIRSVNPDMNIDAGVPVPEEIFIKGLVLGSVKG